MIKAIIAIGITFVWCYMLTWLTEHIRYWSKDITVWKPCNIYPTARIGRNVSIGRFSEIGHQVIVGNNTRIGKGCFIPEGVVIGEGCFIGPHVCFSNDMYPPSPQGKWLKTIVKKGVSIGANVSIRPGITIHEGALIGMGAVVTRDVPARTIVAGIPARKIRMFNREA